MMSDFGEEYTSKYSFGTIQRKGYHNWRTVGAGAIAILGMGLTVNPKVFNCKYTNAVSISAAYNYVNYFMVFFPFEYSGTTYGTTYGDFSDKVFTLTVSIDLMPNN